MCFEREKNFSRGQRKTGESVSIFSGDINSCITMRICQIFELTPDAGYPDIRVYHNYFNQIDRSCQENYGSSVTKGAFKIGDLWHIQKERF